MIMPWTRLSRFRWVFIGSLVVLFILVEVARYLLFPYLDSWTGRVAMDLVILGGAIFVFGGGFELLDTMQRRLDRPPFGVTQVRGRIRSLSALVPSGTQICRV